MRKDCLYPLRCFHGRLHEWKRRGIKEIVLKKYLRFPKGKKVYLLGTPDHANIGDSAIVLAEIEFLKKCGMEPARIKELTVSEQKNLGKKIVRFVGKNNIFWHGGGNMGNQWINEELFRRQELNYFLNNPSMIFPQTIYYTLDAAGQVEMEASKPIYDRENITIVAREKKSFERINELYPKTRKLLTPDIVLSTTMKTFGVEPKGRKGALLCMRSDTEQLMPDDAQREIELIVKKRGYSICWTDMVIDGRIAKNTRFEAVQNKMQEFAEAELVVTDRLHGMVFAAITETPCIVFSNNNHKVQGTYEWIGYLPYIKYAEATSEVAGYIDELRALDECVYNNDPLWPYFERLAEVVKDYVGN